jgi:hypothetical protein
MLVVHCTLRAPQSIPFLNNSSLRKVVLSHWPRSNNTRSVAAKQLDEGIVDTFVSVGVKNGAHPSVSISASDSARIPRAAHLKLLLDEVANLVSFRLRLTERSAVSDFWPLPDGLSSKGPYTFDRRTCFCCVLTGCVVPRSIGLQF